MVMTPVLRLQVPLWPRSETEYLLGHDDPVAVLNGNVFLEKALHNPLDVNKGLVFLAVLSVANQFHLGTIGKLATTARRDDRLHDGKFFIFRQQHWAWPTHH